MLQKEVKMSYQITGNKIAFNTVTGLCEALEELMISPASNNARYVLYYAKEQPDLTFPLHSSYFDNNESTGTLIFTSRDSDKPSRRTFEVNVNSYEQYPNIKNIIAPHSRKIYITNLTCEGIITNFNNVQYVVNSNLPEWERLVRVLFWTKNNNRFPKDEDYYDVFNRRLSSDYATYLGWKEAPPEPFDFEPVLVKLFDSTTVSVLLKKLNS